jgi:hypothetical protein
MSNLPQFFEIRDAPKPNGNVIAIWRKDEDNHQLIFGTKDVVSPPEDDDNKRTFGPNDEMVIEHTLMNRITEPEFSVHDEISEIPHIISDGVLHHLGVLEWHHKWHSFTEGWKYIKCNGIVYVRIINLEAQDIIDKIRVPSSESSDSVS